jgi:hypothetical protein
MPDMADDIMGENQLSFSITQGLQMLKKQLNLDLNDLLRNGKFLDENQDTMFANFDINNPDISNLLRTPPTIGTQLHNFRQQHDLRNQLPVNGEVSSQSSSSDGGVEDKAFIRAFGMFRDDTMHAEFLLSLEYEDIQE